MKNLKIADHVKQIHYGHEGYIDEIYGGFNSIEFFSMSRQEWLEAQIIPFTKKQIEQETWYSVKCFDGGSILSPESFLRLVEPNPVNTDELLNH